MDGRRRRGRRAGGVQRPLSILAPAFVPLPGPCSTSPGMPSTPSAIRRVVSRIDQARSRYPCSPIATSAAQHAAESAPGREPAMVGV